MMQHEITSEAGARPRRKRVGRGESSGMGRTSGRGNKGAQSRAGYKRRWTSEGGQMPIFRRVPKRGFNNFHFRDEYEVVNIGTLNEVFESGASINAQSLKDHGLVRRRAELVKILGEGELSKKFNVEIDGISESAKAAIEKAGGSVKLIIRRDSAALAKAKRGKGERTQKKQAAENKKK